VGNSHASLCKQLQNLVEKTPEQRNLLCIAGEKRERRLCENFTERLGTYFTQKCHSELAAMTQTATMHLLKALFYPLDLMAQNVDSL
jgi:hypothetical protein